MAVVVNKISDLALLCAFAAVFYYNKSFFPKLKIHLGLNQKINQLIHLCTQKTH